MGSNFQSTCLNPDLSPFYLWYWAFFDHL